MGFWTAIMIIVVVAICTEFIIRVVKMGIKHSENIERMRHGYPTVDGAVPVKKEKDELELQVERLQ